MKPFLIYSVGQCGFDHSNIASALSDAGCATRNIQSERELHLELRKELPSLILVNRLLDRDGQSGVSVIRNLKNNEHYRHVPVMLVSNYTQAQEEAVDAGALPGFGKNSLFDQDTIERIKSIVTRQE